MFDINEYLREHKKFDNIIGRQFRKLAPKIECQDGFAISVQASDIHYCKPRVVDANTYSEVEAGYPTEKEDLLMPFAENEDAPTDTVYGWVPVEIINEVVEKHGGEKGE